MAFIVENGSGIISANTYNTIAFITAYLTDRNRQTENGWGDLDLVQQQAASVAATDYIETRWRLAFKGRKKFLDLRFAKNTLTFVQNPAAAEQAVIGVNTYTFQTVLASANDVLIGISAEASLFNLVSAINFSTGEGTLYGSGTVAHPDVAAAEFTNDTIIAEARVSGLAGNSIVTTTTVTGASWITATLQDGSDIGLPQPLSFPRVNLFDSDFAVIRGIPERLKQAVSEYAVRAVASILQPDIVADDTGGQVTYKREKVGPIEEETHYRVGGRISLSKPYPAADRLLSEFVETGGTLIRA